jgi:transcriptional regulator with XRE-family HTH domain
LSLKLKDYAIDRQKLRKLRRRGGHLLRQRRNYLGLTQQQLAERVDLEPYTLLDQLESGIGRIEPYQYQQWADALELPLQKFVAEVLRHVDPVAHELLVSPERQATC